MGRTLGRGKPDFVSGEIYSITINGKKVSTLGISGDDLIKGPNGHVAFLEGVFPSKTGIGRLATMNDDGSGVHLLRRIPQGRDSPSGPSWSTDGRLLAQGEGSGCGDDETPCDSWRTLLVDSRTGAVKLAIPDAENASFSPDGGALAFENYVFPPPCGSCGPPDRVSVLQLKTQKRKRIVDGVFPAWSPRGNWISYVAPDGWLHVTRPDSHHHDRRLALGGGTGYAWSPNGKGLAFTRYSGQRLVESVFVVTAGNRKVHRVGGPYTQRLAWSPDSSKLAWVGADGQDRVRLLTAPAKGSARPDVIFRTTPNWRIDSLIWSADGTRILFTLVLPR
jgi:hypothetical protein